MRGSPSQERKGRKMNYISPSRSSSFRGLEGEEGSGSGSGSGSVNGSVSVSGSGNDKGDVNGKGNDNARSIENILRIWQTERCVPPSV